MLVGYARTSTTEQEAGFEAQRRDLRDAGIEKLFEEQVSSVGTRKRLADALDFVREGDTLIVTKLDRMARSTADALRIKDQLAAKKVNLRILNINLDTSTPIGKMMFAVIAAVAEFEREMMLERQREGIAKAKAEGVYKGRKPTARAKTTEIKALANTGISMSEIARQLGIGKSSVHRALSAGLNGDKF